MFSSAAAAAAEEQKQQSCSSRSSPTTAMAEVQVQRQELERASACHGLLSKLARTGDHQHLPHHPHYHHYLAAANATVDSQQQQPSSYTDPSSTSCSSSSSLFLNHSFNGPLSSLLRTTSSTNLNPPSAPDTAPQDHHHHSRSSLLHHQIASSAAADEAGAADQFVAQQQQQQLQQLQQQHFTVDHQYHGSMASSSASARTSDYSSFYDAIAAARSLYHHHPQFNPPSAVPPSLHHLLSPYGSLQSGVAMAGEQGRAAALFTPGQLRELQQQALVLRYIKSGVNVPAELLNPIRFGSNTIAAAFASPNFVGWGGYRLGFGVNADPEPGRCRRTDGKKWRCSRDVVPDQKYCERHIHRGRHRSRKPTDSTPPPPPPQQQQQPPPQSLQQQQQQTGSSPPGSSVTAPPILSSSSSPLHHQQLSPNLAIRPYSSTNSPSASGLSVGSSITASQYNQMQMHSTSKYIGGIRSDLDLGAEQMLFSETSGSTRAISQDFHSMSQQGGLSMLPSIGNSWRTSSMQQSRAPSPNAPQQPMKASSPSIMQYSSPQLRMLLNNQDFSLMSADTDSGSLHSMAPQSQQHQYSFLGSGYGSVEAVSSVGGGREQESQPLRHFFDDWPKSKDASTLCWAEVEEEKPNRNVSTTQLSISIPVSSSDFNTSSPPGKLKLSPLKLSMSRAGEDDISLGVDLGVGMGLGASEDRHHQHQAHWIPIAWETPVGGPLAEVLQSSTPRASKNSGLNLMTEGWEESPRSSTQICSSPTGERESEARGELEVLKGTD